LIFRDDFNGRLAEGWSFEREDRANWRVGPAGLEVRVQPGGMWGGGNNANNVMVHAIPAPTEAPIEISVTFSNQPTVAGVGLGAMALWPDAPQGGFNPIAVTSLESLELEMDAVQRGLAPSSEVLGVWLGNEIWTGSRGGTLVTRLNLVVNGRRYSSVPAP